MGQANSGTSSISKRSCLVLHFAAAGFPLRASAGVQALACGHMLRQTGGVHSHLLVAAHLEAGGLRTRHGIFVGANKQSELPSQYSKRSTPASFQSKLAAARSCRVGGHLQALHRGISPHFKELLYCGPVLPDLGPLCFMQPVLHMHHDRFSPRCQ